MTANQFTNSATNPAGYAGGDTLSSHPTPSASPFFGHARQIADALARIETEKNARRLMKLRFAADFEMECV